MCLSGFLAKAYCKVGFYMRENVAGFHTFLVDPYIPTMKYHRT